MADMDKYNAAIFRAGPQWPGLVSILAQGLKLCLIDANLSSRCIAICLEVEASSSATFFGWLVSGGAAQRVDGALGSITAACGMDSSR
ncbi:hypothetical protein X755_31970 [Mesorhizobium sp. LNJC405B00]|nr:hypothetical protein X755_31970 [Mesorhizobium sp. LNJC405B00]